MNEFIIIIIIAIFYLQLEVIAVGGMFYILYKFYNLFKTLLFDISSELKQLDD